MYRFWKIQLQDKKYLDMASAGYFTTVIYSDTGSLKTDNCTNITFSFLLLWLEHDRCLFDTKWQHFWPYFSNIMESIEHMSEERHWCMIKDDKECLINKNSKFLAHIGSHGTPWAYTCSHGFKLAYMGWEGLI